MMMLVSAVLGGLGILCVVSRRTLLGVMIGLQLLLMGATTAFVTAGALSDDGVRGHLFGLFILLSGVALLVVGYALAIRFSLLKSGTVRMDRLEQLKH